MKKTNMKKVEYNQRVYCITSSNYLDPAHIISGVVIGREHLIIPRPYYSESTKNDDLIYILTDKPKQLMGEDRFWIAESRVFIDQDKAEQAVLDLRKKEIIKKEKEKKEQIKKQIRELKIMGCKLGYKVTKE